MTSSPSGTRPTSSTGPASPLRTLRLMGLALAGGVITASLVPATASTLQATEAPTAPDRPAVAEAVPAAEVSGVSVAPRGTAASPPTTTLPTTATSWDAMPLSAMGAYQRSAEVIGAVRPECHLSWTTLAAIGQIESDHGRVGGRQVSFDGASSSPVRGAVLDGTRGTTRVVDTDAGEIDGDTAFDRGVGSMQFLPSTWISIRVDGDGDGVRSPDDVDDAALAAAVFLCGSGDDLATDAGALAALARYDHGAGYAAGALALSRQYAAGSYSSAFWMPTVAWSPAVVATATDEATRADSALSGGTSGTSAAADTSPDTSSSSGAVAAGEPTPSTVPIPGATDSPSASPSTSPSADPSSPTSPSTTPGATPAETPSESPAETPSETPAETPSETPAETPSESPGQSPDPSPEPSEPTEPVVTILTGVLESCGDADFCVGGDRLDVGGLGDIASADFDGDGATESLREELTGLVGVPVVVRITDGALTSVTLSTP